MRPGDLQAQVPWRNAFWFADREARQRLSVRVRDLWRTRAVPCCDSGPLVAHGLLRNHRETEVSHSPTVSRGNVPGGQQVWHTNLTQPRLRQLPGFRSLGTTGKRRARADLLESFRPASLVQRDLPVHRAARASSEGRSPSPRRMDDYDVHGFCSGWAALTSSSIS